VRLIIAVVIACVLYACTNDMTTQHPAPVEPLQWRGQLDQDSGYAYDWVLNYTDASISDPYLHPQIDLDAAVPCAVDPYNHLPTNNGCIDASSD